MRKIRQLINSYRMNHSGSGPQLTNAKIAISAANAYNPPDSSLRRAAIPKTQHPQAKLEPLKCHHAEKHARSWSGPSEWAATLPSFCNP